MTGEELFAELDAAAREAGVSITRFAAPIFPCAHKIEQLRLAKKVRQGTIARVRALIAGEPVPPPNVKYIRDPRAIGLSRRSGSEWDRTQPSLDQRTLGAETPGRSPRPHGSQPADCRPSARNAPPRPDDRRPRPRIAKGGAMMATRLEIEPDIFRDRETVGELTQQALDAMPFGPLARRQRMLDQVRDLAVKKILVMRWLEKREIWGDEAEQLIKDNGLEAA
jgi:hypothetical protein